MNERRPKTRYWLWVLVGVFLLGGVVVVGYGVGIVALAFSDLDHDEDKTLADFPSKDSARDFVSAHLPTPLPAEASVEALDYYCFMPLHLVARVAFPTTFEANSYVQQVREQATLNEAFCGPARTEDGGTMVVFFMADSYACGTVRLADTPNELHVTRFTRY